MDPLNDIANRARLLLKFYPDSAERLVKSRQSLKFSREYDTPQEIESQLHAIKCWQANCEDARLRFHDLAILCRRWLPELRLQFVRVGPNFHYDDESLDWNPILAELRLIEDEALTKVLTRSDEAPAAMNPDKVPEGDREVRNAKSLAGSELPAGSEPTTIKYLGLQLDVGRRIVSGPGKSSSRELEAVLNAVLRRFMESGEAWLPRAAIEVAVTKAKTQPGRPPYKSEDPHLVDRTVSKLRQALAPFGRTIRNDRAGDYRIEITAAPAERLPRKKSASRKKGIGKYRAS